MHVKLHEVCVEFENARALNQISLSFQLGECVALTGAAQSGKSTLLKVIAGLVPPSSGLLNVDLATTQKEAPWVGMAFQRNALFDDRSVLNNVLLPLTQSALSQAEQEARARHILDQVGLLDSAALYPGMLSGGMKKRLAIARAMVTTPPIVLLDEPTAGLDPVTSARIYALIDTLTQQHPTLLIMASSDALSLGPHCTRIIEMAEGSVRFDRAISAQSVETSPSR